MTQLKYFNQHNNRVTISDYCVSKPIVDLNSQEPLSLQLYHLQLIAVEEVILTLTIIEINVCRSDIKVTVHGNPESQILWIIYNASSIFRRIYIKWQIQTLSSFKNPFVPFIPSKVSKVQPAYWRIFGKNLLRVNYSKFWTFLIQKSSEEMHSYKHA